MDLLVKFAGQFEEFLGPDVTLVPVPGHAPLRDEHSLWVPRRICEVLVSQGLGVDVVPCLARLTVVPKSAYALPGQRPEAQVHYGSMRVDCSVFVTDRVTVVDDFVTRGDTLLAAASLMKEALPEAGIRAFALVRTIGLQPNVERIIDPCVGTIFRGLGGARRRP